MPADAVASGRAAARRRLDPVEQAFADRPDYLGPQSVEAVPDKAAALADDPPGAFPAGAEAVGAPAAAIGEDLAAAELEDGGRRRPLRGTRNWPAPIPGNRRPWARRSPCSGRRRTYGSPCRAAAHDASPRGSRRNAARRRSRHGCWSARRSRRNRESAGCA